MNNKKKTELMIVYHISLSYKYHFNLFVFFSFKSRNKKSDQFLLIRLFVVVYFNPNNILSFSEFFFIKKTLLIQSLSLHLSIGHTCTVDKYHRYVDVSMLIHRMDYLLFDGKLKKKEILVNFSL